MKTIAFTGATGFIGRRLTGELHRRGYKIRILLRRPTSVPLQCDSAIIGDLARPQNLAAALADADAVVHSAGIAHAMSGIPADDYRTINTEATIALARAAERAGVRRFVFLSSIRAQTGPSAADVLTEDREARPTDAYGRSKLAAEQGLAQLGLDWVALRPVLVCGPGAKGNMAALAALARSPYPLPLAGIQAKRSLLALDNLVDAVAHVLALPGPLRRPLIVADSETLSVAQMIVAMRSAMGRRGNMIHIPEALIRSALILSGRRDWIERLCAPLVASNDALRGTGWAPQASTEAALATFATSRE
jgi:UDP-glucose 4-epimerase